MIAAARTSTIQVNISQPEEQISTLGRVMKVLGRIRAFKANGEAYGADTALGEAGFTSLEMVNVMLAVEAEFDLMIPAKEITPANFRTAASIAAMIERTVSAS